MLSAVKLISPEDFSWKTKLGELASQIRVLSHESRNSLEGRIKESASQALELLEDLSPNPGDTIPYLIERCSEFEDSFNFLELTCKESGSSRILSKNSHKPINNVIKKICDLMARILISAATNRIKNAKKAELVTESLSKDPDRIMLQLAITSTSDYQNTSLEQKLELLSRTIDLMAIIPRQKRTREVFRLYANATCP